MIVHLSIACDCTNLLFSVCWQGRNTTLAANLVWDCGTGISPSLHDLHTVLDPWLCPVRARCFKSSKANNDLSIHVCCLLICLCIYQFICLQKNSRNEILEEDSIFYCCGVLGMWNWNVWRPKSVSGIGKKCTASQTNYISNHYIEIHRILCAIPG